MKKEISRKSIFLSAWKSKIGYSLNYKDFDELETIIDYYETQLKKQKEVIDKAIEYIKKNSKTNPNLSGLLVESEINTLLDILKEVSE